MTAYVINKERHSVYSQHLDASEVNMSEDFGHEWGRKYILLRNEGELLMYWTNNCGGEEIQGIDAKKDAFEDWINKG